MPQFLYQSMLNQSPLIVNQSVSALSHLSYGSQIVHVGRLSHPNLTLCNCCFSSVAGNSYTNSQVRYAPWAIRLFT
jgi:hypothetical protein